jgi:hypothetical protein
MTSPHPWKGWQTGTVGVSIQFVVPRITQIYLSFLAGNQLIVVPVCIPLLFRVVAEDADEAL